jgi:glutamate synthase domain-containing protein 2
MNEIVLRTICHGLTPQWKKDYNHKYYMANKEKWSKYYTQSRDELRGNYKDASRQIKDISKNARKQWKESKKQAKSDAKRGYRYVDDATWQYNPSTQMYDIVPYKRKEKYSMQEYKQDLKDARRENKKLARDIAYETKKSTKGVTKQIIDQVKQEMKNIKMSDMSFGEKIKALHEGKQIIREAKRGQRRINMQLTLMQIRSLGFNPWV